jgi:hypothetical protein
MPTPATPPPVAEKPGMLKLPDDTEVAALNGVANPPKLLWDLPQYHPIVAVERHGALDWFKHADGSYSTTMMNWRSDLGRYDATSFSLHPLAPAPTAPLTGQSDTPPVKKQ